MDQRLAEESWVFVQLRVRMWCLIQCGVVCLHDGKGMGRGGSPRSALAVPGPGPPNVPSAWTTPRYFTSENSQDDMDSSTAEPTMMDYTA